MAERKKTYITSSNKHAVREFLIQRFQFESIEGLDGQDINEYITYIERKEYKENEIYTYSDLYNKIQYYNKKITETKISSGEVVFILGDYSIESIALFFSLTFNNNIIVPITSENKDEINERFEVANPNWIINLKENSYTYFSENIEVERHNILINLIQQKIAGLILFSSGSTGKPKAMLEF